MDLKNLFDNSKKYIDKDIQVEGWIRNHRKQKEFGFIDFSDGTCFNHLQLVYDDKLEDFDKIQSYSFGSSIIANGKFVKSEGKGQDYELKVSSIELVGDCPESYPMQPKRHTMEFLREQAYLRPRTNLFQAVFRVRSVIAYAIHKYFQDNNYVYLHSPLITCSDCEGAGETFQVTTLDLDRVAKSGKVDYSKDFFNKKATLTVSGQLQGETFALAYKKIYTFGPTFRAENSNTKTHANEFWMIEPEIAFCDLDQDMDVMEDVLKYVVKYVLDKCPVEMEFFDKFVEKGLINKLNKLLKSKFNRVTHKEVIDILKKADTKFEFEPKYGEDIAREHEKYITEYFDGPVFITNWPKDIKAFYMRLNDDNETVAAVDLEVPGSGELMGGSQREERLDVLRQRIKDMDMDESSYDWYLKLREYGGCKHAGFGIGFERLIMYITGVSNIRDVIPYPRTPGNCDY